MLVMVDDRDERVYHLQMSRLPVHGSQECHRARDRSKIHFQPSLNRVCVPRNTSPRSSTDLCDSDLRDVTHVRWTAITYVTLDRPTSATNDLRHLLGRHQQVVEPRSDT